MKTFESQLSGHDRMVLSNSPSVTAAKLRDIKHVGDVKLWSQPYEILQARSTAPSELLRAAQLERMPFTIAADPEESGKKKDDTRRNERRLQALKLARLLQLRGMYGVSASDRTKNQQPTELSEAAERGAKYYYLRALPQQEQLEAVARAERLGEEIAPGRRLTKEFVDAYQRVRDDAAYWLGLVWLEQKAYQSADPYFDKMTLQANPDGPWANGARYNLARSYEAQGKLPEAIKLYQADRSPQRYGNRLRAERLKEQTAEKKPEKADAKKTDMKKK
jgi:tetratricopeptide (TPR) repeat protein